MLCLNYVMSTVKPCGEHHPLPCGLDTACPVPVEFYSDEQSVEDIVDKWESQR